MLKEITGCFLFYFSIFLLRLYGFFIRKEYCKIETKKEDIVLVFAPHADDETIGCGGIILNHVRVGSTVTVINVTDGSYGQHGQRSEGLKELRKKELREVCNEMGVEDVLYLAYLDRTLEADESKIQTVMEIILEKKPTIIYLPFFCDHHKDHVVTNLIVCKALEKGKYECEIRAYEVQVPITSKIFNGYFEITEIMEEKVNLLKHFKSQTFDYFQNVLFSWKINGYYIKRAAAVEVFYVTGAEFYTKLVSDFVKKPEKWVANFYSSGSKAKILLTYTKGNKNRKKIRKMIQREKIIE